MKTLKFEDPRLRTFVYRMDQFWWRDIPLIGILLQNKDTADEKYHCTYSDGENFKKFDIRKDENVTVVLDKTLVIFKQKTGDVVFQALKIVNVEDEV